MKQSYLDFIDLGMLRRYAKTDRLQVTNRSSGRGLGYIKWWSPWRRYVFSPWADTVYDAKCLNEIQAKLDALMEARRKK